MYGNHIQIRAATRRGESPRSEKAGKEKEETKLGANKIDADSLKERMKNCLKRVEQKCQLSYLILLHSVQMHQMRFETARNQSFLEEGLRVAVKPKEYKSRNYVTGGKGIRNRLATQFQTARIAGHSINRCKRDSEDDKQKEH